jgi:hypothetical protein
MSEQPPVFMQVFSNEKDADKVAEILREQGYQLIADPATGKVKLLEIRPTR